RENNTKIINTILNLGESLDLNIIAEGVETEKQYQYLKERNCHGFQGFYFTKPTPFRDITQHMKAGKGF
ncbi:MAG: EAL domain-containing protein, partial [Spirochaetota bacterium]